MYHTTINRTTVSVAFSTRTAASNHLDAVRLADKHRNVWDYVQKARALPPESRAMLGIDTLA